MAIDMVTVSSILSRIESLAKRYDESERVALDTGKNAMDYRPTYDRAFAAGLRAAAEHFEI